MSFLAAGSQDYGKMLVSTSGLAFLDWALSFGLAHFGRFDDEGHFKKPGAIAVIWILYLVFYGFATLVTQNGHSEKICMAINFILRLFVSLTIVDSSYPFFVFFHCALLLGLLVMAGVGQMLSKTNDADLRGFVLSQNINITMVILLVCTFLGISSDCDVDETGGIVGGFLLAYCFLNYMVVYDRSIHHTYSSTREYNFDNSWMELAGFYFNPFPILRDAFCCGN